MTKAPLKTPVRRALREHSSLFSSIQDGMGAVESAHQQYFEASIRSAFADSLDLDEALKPGREKENRWDYLLGHGQSGQMVAVEPHSAKDDEVETVIRKRRAAREQLRGHLRDGVMVAKWLWVASGKVRFAATEKTALRLYKNGIEFVGKVVMAKHLPVATGPRAAGAARSRSKRRR